MASGPFNRIAPAGKPSGTQCRRGSSFWDERRRVEGNASGRHRGVLPLSSAARLGLAR